jgi:predicted helicase
VNRSGKKLGKTPTRFGEERGFEILPAPFVVAHLQVGLVLQTLGVPLELDHDRACVFLTNALTGWEPVNTKPLPFPELEEERKRAERVKQVTPILVVLGNPPYNGFAGMAVAEERNLTMAYRTTKKVRRPEGQGLNDLYVRFFRMAEQRIAEKTGRGIVCLISNYSWLDSLSFTGMRERYLEAFDIIRIDSLNGDKFKTGKTTPEGLPDPSIFSTEHNREGIQVGTAIATLIRKESHTATSSVAFRNLWGTSKHQQLLTSMEAEPSTIYKTVTPSLELGLPYVQTAVIEAYQKWPSLPDLLPSSFPGVKTSRDEFLVSIDREMLNERIKSYFDPKVSHDELRSRFRAVMTASGRYDPIKTRDTLLKRGMLPDNIIPYAYRPFDIRWVYWEPETKLLDEKRSEYMEDVAPGNIFLSAGARNRKEDFYQPQIARCIADHHIVESNVGLFPLYLREHGNKNKPVYRPNLSWSMKDFLKSRDLPATSIFFHVLAILHDPRYHTENAGALRMGWPRVPVPADVKRLSESAELGSNIANLLDSTAVVPGISKGKLRVGLRMLGVPHKKDGKPLEDSDLSLSVGWGHVQISRTGSTLVMPGPGLVNEREYTTDERKALEGEAEALGMKANVVMSLLGAHTVDVHLNASSMWKNVPINVWNYNMGGYLVLKKWLSYREKEILGRVLKPDEVAHVSEIVRRIAAILLSGPALDLNYEASKADAVDWGDIVKAFS